MFSVGHGIGGLTPATGLTGGLPGGPAGLTGGTGGLTGGLTGGTGGFTGGLTGGTGGFTGGLTGGTGGLTGGLTGGTGGLTGGLTGDTGGFGLGTDVPGFDTGGLAIALRMIYPDLLLSKILKDIYTSIYSDSDVTAVVVFGDQINLQPPTANNNNHLNKNTQTLANTRYKQHSVTALHPTY